MTGYGKGVFEDAGHRFSVEIKSVNNKFGEFNLRLPRLFNPFEEQLRKYFSTEISRGRVDAYISYENNSDAATKIKYNSAAAKNYHKVLKELMLDIEIEPSDSTLLNLISKFPDVIEIDREVDDTEVKELWTGLEEAARLALFAFVQMREREGEALKTDLKARLKTLCEVLGQVEAKAPEVNENHRIKLKKRMYDALAEVVVDEARFLNEVAHFADKSDISEEITRMKSHIAQFNEILEADGAIGRKLDFLTQEMAREANTMGGKSNLADMQKIVIELKSEVEKVREQVQNIE